MLKRGCDERLHNVWVKGVIDLSSMQINDNFLWPNKGSIFLVLCIQMMQYLDLEINKI